MKNLWWIRYDGIDNKRPWKMMTVSGLLSACPAMHFYSSKMHTFVLLLDSRQYRDKRKRGQRKRRQHAAKVPGWTGDVRFMIGTLTPRPPGHTWGMVGVVQVVCCCQMVKLWEALLRVLCLKLLSNTLFHRPTVSLNVLEINSYAAIKSKEISC